MTTFILTALIREIPTLLAEAPSNYANISSIITLPGSSQFYSYKNHSKTTELLDNVILSRDRHLMTFGAGLLLRNLSGYLTAGQDGEYTFYRSVRGAQPAAG